MAWGSPAKEHIAIAEKLLSEPPKERFDRVVVDKKVANREGHLRELRDLIERVRTSMSGRTRYTPGRRRRRACRQRLLVKFQKMDQKLQDMFPKFFYKQRVLEDMILVAGNVHEKFKSSLRHIEELEAKRKSAEQRATLHANTTRSAAWNNSCAGPMKSFTRPSSS